MAENNHETAARRAKVAASALQAAAAEFQGTVPKLPEEILKKLHQANHALASSEEIFGYDDVVDPPPDLVASQWRQLAKRLSVVAEAVRKSGGRKSPELLAELRRANSALASSETIIVAFNEAIDPLPDNG